MESFSSIFTGLQPEEMMAIFNRLPSCSYSYHGHDIEWDRDHRWIIIRSPDGFRGWVPGTSVNGSKVIYVDDVGDLEAFSTWVFPCY